MPEEGEPGRASEASGGETAGRGDAGVTISNAVYNYGAQWPAPAGGASLGLGTRSPTPPRARRAPTLRPRAWRPGEFLPQ